MAQHYLVLEIHDEISLYIIDSDRKRIVLEFFYIWQNGDDGIQADVTQYYGSCHAMKCINDYIHKRLSGVCQPHINKDILSKFIMCKTMDYESGKLPNDAPSWIFDEDIWKLYPDIGRWVLKISSVLFSKSICDLKYTDNAVNPELISTRVNSNYESLPMLALKHNNIDMFRLMIHHVCDEELLFLYDFSDDVEAHKTIVVRMGNDVIYTRDIADNNILHLANDYMKKYIIDNLHYDLLLVTANPKSKNRNSVIMLN